MRNTVFWSIEEEIHEKKQNQSSREVRFLGLVKQPNSVSTDQLEFEEEEILWTSYDSDRSLSRSSPQSFLTKIIGISVVQNNPNFPISENISRSAPMNIPIWPKKEEAEIFDEKDEKSDEEFVPPHEIVARSNKTSFSVYEGLGRTLKGRDLRKVRNAVWRKTGFLD